MLVVDASCLFEVVADTPRAKEIAARLAADVEQAAPHLIDVEVLGVIRAQHLQGRLDRTAASQAVDDLRDWPGERIFAGELAHIRYKEGRIDFLRVLDAERTRLEAEDGLAAAQTAANVDVVSIYKALGGSRT